MIVIPTVFAHNKKEFLERFNRISKAAKNIQIDFMDGKLVPSKGIEIRDVAGLKSLRKNFEAHLMVKDPEVYFAEAKKKGFKKIIIHREAFIMTSECADAIEKIQKLKLKAFVAINPETPISAIVPLLNRVDGVLVMGVHPGKEHQQFIGEIYDKLRKLRAFNPNVVIQVDGGVNFDVAKGLKMIGVNEINTGSMTADAKNPKEIIEELEEI